MDVIQAGLAVTLVAHVEALELDASRTNLGRVTLNAQSVGNPHLRRDCAANTRADQLRVAVDTERILNVR